MVSTNLGIRAGLSRGLIEFRNAYVRNPEEVVINVFLAVGFAVVLFFQRNSTVEGTTLSLAAVVLPGILGLMVGFGGVMGASGVLAIEREDGTLLRAKAIPHGMAGYFVGKVVMLAMMTAVTLAIILAAGLVFVPELLEAGVTGWLLTLGVLALGLVAVLPWGAVIGSLVKSPNSAFGLTMLSVGVLTAISGIFYPITAMAGWVQAIAQVFPIYWLGHGMRAALLPDAAVAAEIGESWRYLEMFGVLGAWAVAGLLLAPPILRRMARKESGGNMEQRRQAALQRMG